MPEDPGPCPHCGARAWRRNGTYPRHLVVLGALDVQRWQCKACLGSASPLPPGVTSRQRSQTFRELAADLYVHSVRCRGLARILALLGCGVGATTLWRDVQAVAPGREPDPQGERLDLRLSGPGFDWNDGFMVLAERGVRGVTTDDAPAYGPALRASGLDRQPCTCSAPWDGTSAASTTTV